MSSDGSDPTSLGPGFPIRTPSDQRSVDNSPRTIAASHVLHQLLVPRHPPCAHHTCHTKKMLASTIQFSNNNQRERATRSPSPLCEEGRESGTHRDEHRPTAFRGKRRCRGCVLSDTQQRTDQPVFHDCLLRKEVIQPHLPVRLPCYDFVPIASPTFDHSPHTRWLGHGLRVLPTFMT